jgi:hypothetical protein
MARECHSLCNCQFPQIVILKNSSRINLTADSTKNKNANRRTCNHDWKQNYDRIGHIGQPAAAAALGLMSTGFVSVHFDLTTGFASQSLSQAAAALSLGAGDDFGAGAFGVSSACKEVASAKTRIVREAICFFTG